MNELSDARAELARLQHRELELLQEFFDVRKAVAAQKTVIDELIKASCVPYIDRLPNELLVQIFLLTNERECLASVSRRWRAVIVYTPRIWCEINLDTYSSLPNLSKLESDLKRSRQVPLTISLSYFRSLEVLFPHVDRIHSLQISGDALSILGEPEHLTFPSLNVPPTMYPCFPALKCLHLQGFGGPSYGTLPGASSGLISIAAESLTELSLSGATPDWVFHLDSIHFPVLQSLTLRTSDPISFLEAIVAPNLKLFEFTAVCSRYLSCKTFNGPTSKFENVHHLVFVLAREPIVDGVALKLVEEFCRVFRGVHHASITMACLDPLFSPCRAVGRPDDLHSPIDNWLHLKSLEIRDFTSIRAESFQNFMDWFIANSFEYFMDWVTKRKNLGHLKLIYVNTGTDYLIVRRTFNASNSRLHQTLQECCASVEYRTAASSQIYLSTSPYSRPLPLPVFGAGLISQTESTHRHGCVLLKEWM